MNSAKVLSKFSDILLNHSLGGIKKKDVVMIKGEAIAWPLISELQSKIARAGGMPDVFLVPPDNERGRVWSATVARYIDPERLRMPKWHILRYKAFTKYIEILGMERPELVTGVMTRAMAKIIGLNAETVAIRCSKPWAITAFPTRAMAKMEGISYPEYEKILYRAVTQELGPLAKMAARLSAKLRKTRSLRILTREPGRSRGFELKMDVSRSIILNDTDGPPVSSLPCGEIYTSPDANSVEGEIFWDLPFSTQGDVIEGVYMRFKGGKAVDFRARRGQRFLDSILATDDGARRIGEVAFGFNPQLTRPMLDPLFCEKLAGTMHLALGSGFPAAHVKNPDSASGRRRYRALLRSGAANVSGQHVDLVLSFRSGGAGRAVYLDGKRLLLRNGNWQV